MELEQLEKKFKGIHTQYDSIKTLCESKVVRWEWATGSMYDLRPFYFERNRWSRGRKLKEEPSVKNGKCQYGFDQNNNIVICRDYVEFSGQFYEEFFIIETDFIESMRFDYSKEKNPINICRYDFCDNKIISSMCYARYGCTIETYKYDHDKVIEIKIWQREHGKNPNESFVIINYDEFGSLKFLAEKYPDDENPCVIYQRLDKQYTLKDLCDIAEQKMVQLIPDLIYKLGIEDKIYCLVIAYDLESDSPLPPLLGIGLENERKLWIEKYGKGAKDYIWNPAEFTYFGNGNLVLKDPVLNKACSLINQEVCMKDNYKLVRKLLNTVAVHLTKIDLNKFMNITQDFVIYAVDLECVDFRKNLKTSTPSDTIDFLKRRGLL